MRVKIAIFSGILAIFLAFVGFNTYAATIHVPVDYATIQGAIDAAVDGDLILVAEGTYRENINFYGKAITLQSEAGPENTIIDGQDGAARVVQFETQEEQNTILDGFTIKNGNVSLPEFGGGIECYITSPTIRNCIIRDNVGGGIHFYRSHGLIENCLITKNAAYCYGGGIYCDISSNLTIKNCTITENETATDGGGIYLLNISTGLTIENCLIYRNISKGWGGGLFSAYNAFVRPTVKNCVIALNEAEDYGGGVAVMYDGGVDLKNSIIWENRLSSGELSQCYKLLDMWSIIRPFYCDIQDGSEYQYGYPGNIVEDPLFVDLDGLDFHLQFASPCIDTGDPESDYSNEPEPNGNRINMGAYGNTAEATRSIGFQPNLDGQIFDLSILPFKLIEIEGLEGVKREVISFNAIAADQTQEVGIVVSKCPAWLKYYVNPGNPTQVIFYTERLLQQENVDLIQNAKVEIIASTLALPNEKLSMEIIFSLGRKPGVPAISIPRQSLKIRK